MLTSFDLLIIVFLVFLASALAAIPLMFLIKNKIAKRIFFYVVLSLISYIAYGGIKIGLLGSFDINVILGVFAVLMGIAALVLERVFKNNNVVFLISRIAAANALLIAFSNAFLI